MHQNNSFKFFKIFIIFLLYKQYYTIPYLQNKSFYNHQDLEYDELNSVGKTINIFKYHTQKSNGKTSVLQKFKLDNQDFEINNYTLQVSFYSSSSQYSQQVPGQYHPIILIFPEDSPVKDQSDSELYDRIIQENTIRRLDDLLFDKNDSYYYDAFGFRSLYGHQFIQFPYIVGTYYVRILYLAYEIGFNKYTQCYSQCSQCDITNKICQCDTGSQGSYCQFQSKLLDTNKEYQAYLVYGEWSIFRFNVLTDELYTVETINPPQELTVYTYFLDDFTTDHYTFEPTIHDSEKAKIISSEEPNNYLMYEFKGEILEKYIFECQRRNIQPQVIVALYGKQTQPQSYFQLRIRAYPVDEEGFNSNFLVILSVCLFVLFFFLIYYAIQKWYKKADKKSEVQNQQIRQRQLQQQQAQPQQALQQVPQKEYVCITQDSIQKFMPKIGYHIIQNYFPHYQEYFSSDCTVCLCEFEKDEKIRLTVCMHLFHIECIDPWLKKHGCCPFCREKLNSRTFKDHQYLKEKYSKNDYIKRILSEQKLNRTPLREMKAFDFLFVDNDQFMLKSRNEYLQNSKQKQLLKEQDDSNKSQESPQKIQNKMETSIPTPQPMQNSQKQLQGSRPRKLSQESIQSPEEITNTKRPLQLKPSRFAQLKSNNTEINSNKNLNLNLNTDHDELNNKIDILSPEISQPPLSIDHKKKSQLKKKLIDKNNQQNHSNTENYNNEEDDDDDEEEKIQSNHLKSDQNYFQYSIQEQKPQDLQQSQLRSKQISTFSETQNMCESNVSNKKKIRQQQRIGKKQNIRSPQKSLENSQNFEIQPEDPQIKKVIKNPISEQEQNQNSAQKLKDSNETNNSSNKNKRKRNIKDRIPTLTIQKPTSQYQDHVPQVVQTEFSHKDNKIEHNHTFSNNNLEQNINQEQYFTNTENNQQITQNTHQNNNQIQEDDIIQFEEDNDDDHQQIQSNSELSPKNNP